MEKFAVIEAGSTTTKGYLYDKGKIINLDFVLIEFKKNYNNDGYISNEDKEKLFSYVKKIEEITDNVYVYGTSIFRILNNKDRENFVREFKQQSKAHFEVVTSDEEAMYTVKGALANIEYDGNIAVIIGGGGSVEIAIANNKEVIETIKLNMGCVDITNIYPDLANDIASTDINDVTNYIKERIVEIHNKADILVLAGSANKYFREKAHYQFLSEVPFNYNTNEMVIIDAKTLLDQDKIYFYRTSLDEMKKNMPDAPNWWNPTRATLCLIEAVNDLVEAKYIAASDINMIYGIMEDIKNDK